MDGSCLERERNGEVPRKPALILAPPLSAPPETQAKGPQAPSYQLQGLALDQVSLAMNLSSSPK